MTDLLKKRFDVARWIAGEIVSCAEKSVGLTDGTDAGRKAVKWFAEEILKLDEQLAQIESLLHEKCMEIPYAENILEINGVGENILAGILAEIGDISRFDDVGALLIAKYVLIEYLRHVRCFQRICALFGGDIRERLLTHTG